MAASVVGRWVYPGVEELEFVMVQWKGPAKVAEKVELLVLESVDSLELGWVE